MPGPLLSAALIVRDEAAVIGGCLRALTPVVDEIVVYDTGSADDTVSIARSAGATVVEGYWDGDFARARNDAAAACSGDWLLVVDADEIVTADVASLRAMLTMERPADGFVVMLHNATDADTGGGYVHWGVRVVRRGALTWSGRVHERPLRPGGEEPRTETMPSHILSLAHHGYADADAVRRKGERNAELAEAELQALLRLRPHDSDAIATVLLHLGRSLIGAGRRQDAVDTFETLRELAPGTPQWAEATDHLARLLLGGGQDEAVLLLSDQLRAAGADGRYCDWLRAQALAQLGSTAEALDLVRGVDALIDPAGRRYGLGQVLEVRALLAAVLGHRDEALTCLASAMVDHGRVQGRGQVLLELWSQTDGSAEDLATLVRTTGTKHLTEVARELRSTPSPGPQVALALAPHL